MAASRGYMSPAPSFWHCSLIVSTCIVGERKTKRGWQRREREGERVRCVNRAEGLALGRTVGCSV